MPDVNLVAVAVATLAAFVLSSTYYTLLAAPLATVSEAAAHGGQPPAWKIAAELLRCLILAAVVAGLARNGGVDSLAGGLLLGAALWIGFPFVLWTGAMIWENAPRRLALIHAGDWLLKLVMLAVIAAVWA